MNDDGVVDSSDLDPFMDALASTDESDFLSRYPDSVYARADINGDFYVNSDDWSPFIDLMNYGVITTTSHYQATYFANQTVQFDLSFSGGGGIEHIDLSWSDNKDDFGVIPSTQFVRPKPVASIAPTVAGTEGSAVTIQGSFSDPTGTGLTASVDWGDKPAAVTNATLQHTSALAGNCRPPILMRPTAITPAPSP